MTAPAPHSDLGRHLFGVAAFAFGVVILASHSYNGWHLPPYLVYAIASALFLGGAAIQFHRAATAAAIFVGAAFLYFALRCVPQIFAKPSIYNSWGNFFEQFALLTGAALVFARQSPASSRETVNRVGRICLGVCATSFALEQAFYLAPTAGLVPKWLPPSQMFWGVATTAFFALAGLALLTNRMALLTTRLLTLMLALFGLIVWAPLLVSSPRNYSNWSETAETFAIAATAWLLADLLNADRPNDHRPRPPKVNS